MLQDMRENAQGTIAKVIIGLLILSLSVWGMDAIIGGFGGEPEVATVNGQDITEREFLRVVQLESQNRLSRMERPDPSLLDEDQIRVDVLQALIEEQVLAQDADEQGLALSDADVDALITQMSQFQVNGQFNRDQFVAVVRNAGMGVGEFRSAMRKQTVVNQIRAGIVASGVVTSDSITRLMKIQNQTRDFRLLSISANAVADQVNVSADDIQAFYDSNPNLFQQLEQVDVSYVVLSLTALADAIVISDEELLTYYQSREADLAREERRAAHILIEDTADADALVESIQQRLADGEDFAALAQELSIDTVSGEQGGDLGFAGRGVYDPAFDEALFSLEPGVVSDPVRTSFGVHLIKVNDVRRSDVPALADVAAQLRDDLAREQAREAYAQARTTLADSAYAADNLEGPAKDLNLELRQADNITRNGGGEPFDHAGLVRQLFSEDVLSGGYNTELIDVADNRAVVARVRVYRGAEMLPLAGVEDAIRSNLEAEKTRTALVARASEMAAQLQAGESLQDITDDSWTTYIEQPRSAPELGGGVMQTVYALPRPQAGGVSYGHTVTGNGAVIIALDKVNEGEVNTDSTEYLQLQEFLASLDGQREYTAYQQWLRNNAEVERP
ncbi:MAG: peptidyl-prolyl cis-trans isomerase D [Marinobacter psychrophilus]|jgi:peptidyl-prolyl cis-trans isomerase D